MTARRLTGLLLAVAVLLVVAPTGVGGAGGVAAAAQTAGADTDPADGAADDGDGGDDASVCDVLPIGPQLACEGVTAGVGAGATGMATFGARAVLDEVVEFVVDGASWLLGGVADVIDSSTRPEVTAGWFTDVYQRMAAIGLAGLLPFLLLALIQGLMRRDAGLLLRATFGYVPLAAIGTGAAVVVVDMLVTITDELSAFIGQSVGADLQAFATGLGSAVTALDATGGAIAGLAALLAGAAVAFASFVIWLELLLRQAAIYVAVLFLPLGFMAMVWPATAHWLKRLVQGLAAIIMSKFVIVAVVALAATAMDAEVATDGYGVVIAGAALLALAALAPYVLLRLIPVFEAGLTSRLEGTLRRPTAAVAPPTGGRPGGVTRLLQQRLGATGGQAHGRALAAGAPGAGSAAGGAGSASLIGGVSGPGKAGGAAGASGPATAAGAAAVGTAAAGVAAGRAGARTAGTTAAQVTESGTAAGAAPGSAGPQQPSLPDTRRKRSQPATDPAHSAEPGAPLPVRRPPPTPPPPSNPPQEWEGTGREET